jgi:type IV pilus assembly protein PilM
MVFGRANVQNESSFWQRLWANPALNWGCEIAPSAVSLVRCGRSSRIEAAALAPLPTGAMEVSPLRENVLRPEEVRQALAECVESLGRSAQASPINIAMVIPDQCARLFFLDFDSLPEKPSEAVPLLRWRLKKSVPFDVESASLSYAATRRDGQWQVLAVVAQAAIVRQYEMLAESVGLKPRFVTLSTLGTLGLMPDLQGAAAGRSVLLAKYSPPQLTTAIVHDGSVCLFRTVPAGSAADGTITPKQVLESVYPSVAYFQDNYSATLDGAYLCGLGESLPAIEEALAGELRLMVLPLPELRVSLPGWDWLQSEQYLSALLGVVQGRRRR